VSEFFPAYRTNEQIDGGTSEIIKEIIGRSL